MSGKQRVEQYVEAVREWKALEKAAQDDGLTPERLHALKAAKVRVSEYRRVLTGGQIGQAHRILEGRA